ncbi:MAG: DegT/DnrJ/EryC1/StrS family aminotransferase [Chloroflexi bacterium]|nr:DegT/DnrJ/EryC1/StrS family aminotransferase [Chloroflexota bacterium]
MKTQLQIPLSNPDISELEIAYVTEVLRTPNLSLGPKLAEFEQKMARFVGRAHAIAVSSGTAGLHLIIRALGIGEGDEVITSPFSFISSANCLLFERARPVFVDIDSLCFNINATGVARRITPRTKAILGVDVFGLPADWEQLDRTARAHQVRLIEDSCEALGAEYKGRKAGTFGDAAIFSFYPNKQMTTGEGGVIVTDDDNIARLCRSMRNQGRGDGDGWLEHQMLGYNYRLSDLNCALGIGQLERIGEILAKRQRVARWYAQRLEGLPELRVPYASPVARRSWFVYVVLLSEHYTVRDRQRILDGLSREGIGCRNYFAPIHLQRFYRERFGYKEGDFPITESVAARTIALPFYSNLHEWQVEQVVDTLKKLL